MERIGVIGVGSIGSVLAMGFGQLGYEIRVNDRDDERVESLPYDGVDKEPLSQWASCIVIAVPTPTTDRGGDASVVEEVVREVTPTESTVVIRSTMPPGETGRLADECDHPLVYSPEFLRDRSDVSDFFDPDRIVLAGPEEERATVRELMEPVGCETIIETDDYLTAEIGKEAHNAFFATKVSFANQIRAIAEARGADSEVVMDVVTADHRNTTSHLDPMLGPYGGKCLPKDTEALRLFGQNNRVPTPLLDGTVRMNELARENYDYLDIEGNWPNITVTSD